MEYDFLFQQVNKDNSRTFRYFHKNRLEAFMGIFENRFKTRQIPNEWCYNGNMAS